MDKKNFVEKESRETIEKAYKVAAKKYDQKGLVKKMKRMKLYVYIVYAITIFALVFEFCNGGKWVAIEMVATLLFALFVRQSLLNGIQKLDQSFHLMASNEMKKENRRLLEDKNKVKDKLKKVTEDVNNNL